MITGQAKVAGVMGWPVGHSRSPQLHGYWLERHGIDGTYIPLPVPPEHFAQALRLLPQLGFAGANITVPHKVTAMNVVDEVDDAARRIGAVNTVVVRPDGSLLGRNTDAFGFIENLRDRAPDWQAAAGPAVVLGAGGAARAVCMALLEVGCPRVTIVNRTRERAEALALSLGRTGGGDSIGVSLWSNRGQALKDAAVLVNTTSLGMDGQPALELDLAELPPEALVNDVVYTPLETPLLAAARARGNPGVDGLGMLLHQARPAFAAWFGPEPEVDDDLRNFVLGAARGDA